MSCSHCAKTGATKQCAGCRSALYCGFACQLQDWQSHRCDLVGMKRGRQSESSEGSKDPITGDSFKGMEPKMIIILEDQRFHLPSLYHWIHNMEHRTNPLTNLEFTQESIDNLEITARERFPMEVQIKEISGRQETLQTTGLISIKKLAFMLYRTDTMNRLIGEMMGEFSYSINREHLSTILLDRSNDQFMVDVLVIIRMMNMGGPHQAIPRYQGILTLARQFNLPTEEIEYRIEVSQRDIGEAQRRQARQNALRERMQRLRADREQELEQPDGTLKVGINIITEEGAAYGTFYVFIDPNERLDTLELLILQHVNGIVRIPREMRFIFAGREYDRNVRISEIRGLVPESVIHVGF